MCADPSARTARCSQTAPAIEKAITEASLGLNPSSDGKVIRAKVPKASKEIRDASLKRLSEAAEVVSQAPATPDLPRSSRCPLRRRVLSMRPLDLRWRLAADKA